MIYYTIQILISTLILQIIFFKFFKFYKLWFKITLFFFGASFIAISIIYKIFNFNFLLFNFVIFLSYAIFLTAVFNDSPTVKVLEISKEDFLKKQFIENRLNFMKKDKLIDDNFKITKKGYFSYKLIKMLSLIFFKET